MKDERLEKEFEEYFKGVNTPDNITGDAKKLVKPAKKVLPKIVKFASVAASFVLVFAVALTVILKTDVFRKPTDGGNSSDSNLPDVPDADFKFYTDAELETEQADAYSVSSLNSSLKFIEKFALAANAGVRNCRASYRNGTLALVQADADVTYGLVRDETKIYVEFTDENSVYDEVKDFYDGTVYSYRGAQYYLIESIGENGEPEFKLHIIYKGVKYYFLVRSSDPTAYQKYLDIVIK